MSLENRVAVVTGAGRGIGKAIAMTLAEMGASVVVNDLGGTTAGGGKDTSPADEVVAEIKAKGAQAVANYESVSEYESAGRIIDAAISSFGKIDILVNNAGISTGGPIYELEPEVFDRVVKVHLYGTFNCTRHACIPMKEQGWGRIVNLVSRAGIVGSGGACAYGSGKGGIFGFTNVVARDLAPFGITVNNVNPQAAVTRMVTEAIDRAKERGADPASAERMIQMAQDPKDVAVVAAFLCTEEAANVNGQTFFAAPGSVGLFQPLTVTQHLVKDGHWGPEELAQACSKFNVPSLGDLY